MVQIKWTDRALGDLEQIYHYIATDSPHQAQSFINQIYERAQILKKFPRLGRIAPEINDELVRELIFHEYRIVYRLIDGTVEIITVFHGSKRLII
jgi:toxin ParE1/3/4